MTKEETLKELKEILMLDADFALNDSIEIDSMSTLMIIEFLDERFNKKANKEDVVNFNSLEEILIFLNL